MAAGYRKCPDCGQDVLKTANECRSCGYSFVTSGAARGDAPEERKYAKVELIVDHLRLVGMIILGGTGFDFRLSDFLNTKAQRFFPLLDVQIYSMGSEKFRHQDVVMVNKESVKLLIILEEPGRKDTRTVDGIVSSTTYRW